MFKSAKRLKDKVYDHCISQGLLVSGMKVIVGVSGGADSVCLLRVLNELRESLDLKITCVHIEHGIRGEESRGDRDFVKKLCEELDIKLKIYETDVPKLAKERSMSLEEAGRYVRYDAFRRELEQDNADVIAVAHHKGDQAETVLFNMIRGSGLKGLSGMSPRNDKIIRPLLYVSRNEIEDYLKEIGQEYRIDSTNMDDGYSRNTIRNRIIPQLEETVSGACDHIIRSADEIREADDFIRDIAKEVYKEAVRETDSLYRIDIGVIKEKAPIVARYVIREVLTGLYTTLKDIEALHVQQVIDLTGRQSGKRVGLPRGMTALREGEYLLIGPDGTVKPQKEKISVCLNIEGDTDVQGYGTFSACVGEYDKTEPIPDSLYTKWFDYDKIISRVLIRNRDAGDYLTVDARESRKKLKSYLIDEKVPVSSRDNILLLADGPHILWVVGMRISEHYKVCEGTKRVLKITYSGKETTNGK